MPQGPRETGATPIGMDSRSDVLIARASQHLAVLTAPGGKPPWQRCEMPKDDLMLDRRFFLGFAGGLAFLAPAIIGASEWLL